MSTGTGEGQTTSWMRVREAITLRWPHITYQELQQCDNDVDELIEFVRSRVGTDRDEVESVVTEYAPEDASTSSRRSQAISQRVGEAGRVARDTYRRTSDQIVSHPAESIVAAFVFGALFGAAMTTLWFQSVPEPTAWEQFKRRGWRDWKCQ